jgi:hypothetical protein
MYFRRQLTESVSGKGSCNGLCTAIKKYLSLEFGTPNYNKTRIHYTAISICDKKYSKAKIVLAFLPKLLYSSFIL